MTTETEHSKVSEIPPVFDRLIDQWTEMVNLLDECHAAFTVIPNQNIDGKSNYHLADKINETLSKFSQDLEI